jgi:hypothetical protein
MPKQIICNSKRRGRQRGRSRRERCYGLEDTLPDGMI